MTYIIENRYSSVKGGTKVWAMLPSSPTVTVVSHRQKEKNLESINKSFSGLGIKNIEACFLCHLDTKIRKIIKIYGEIGEFD